MWFKTYYKNSCVNNEYSSHGNFLNYASETYQDFKECI